MDADGVSMHADPEAYLLEWDLSALGDEEYVAYLIGFPGSRDILELARTAPYDLPAEVYFTGNIQVLKTLDYPYNNVRWPLASERMISILKSVGPFELNEIPVVMLDDSVPKSKCFTNTGEPNDKYALRRFVGMQLLKHLDAFDWEKSEYVRSDDIPSMVVDVTKIVLKVPSGGFPPLFRVSAVPTVLFVSGAARRSLEEQAVSGIRFGRVGEFPPRA